MRENEMRLCIVYCTQFGVRQSFIYVENVCTYYTWLWDSDRIYICVFFLFSLPNFTTNRHDLLYALNLTATESTPESSTPTEGERERCEKYRT